MKFIDDAKLKFGVWNRERKERAEARKAINAATHSEHGHGKFFLLTVPAAATICAAVVEWYWALLFCIEATGHIDWNYETAFGTETTASNIWNFAFSAHWPVLVGLVAATVPIVMLSMVWLPVQFSMRGSGRWRRGSVILCGILANILVIVSGTVVMNYNRQEQVRESVVVEQTAAQGRAAIDARLAFEQEQLRLALSNTNPYLNQAANVGAAEWERSYVAQARATNDPRLPQLERALGAARAADERRANIERLTIERATAAPEAATASNVEDTVGRELNTFAQYVEVWRPPFVAVICTLIGIFGAWWVIALMQGLNPRDVLRSGWADEGHRIEDLRAEEPIVPQPMKPAREVVTDAETGEELVKVKPREYWRRAKGKRQKLDIQPEIPPDETGVTTDGGQRTAVTLGGEMEVESAIAEAAHNEVNDAGRNVDRDDEAGDEDGGADRQSEQHGKDADSDLPVVQTQPPEVSEQEAADALAELESASITSDFPPESIDAANNEAEHHPDAEPTESTFAGEQGGDEQREEDEQPHHEPRQPEQREDRLLNPPVAAE